MAMTITDFYCAVSMPQVFLRSLPITLTRDRDHYYLCSVTEETETRVKAVHGGEGRSCGMRE